MTKWETKLTRLEEPYDDDTNRRIEQAVDDGRADGWQPVGVITSTNSMGLYVVFERPVQEAVPA